MFPAPLVRAGGEAVDPGGIEEADQPGDERVRRASMPCLAARSATAPLRWAISVGRQFIRSWSMDARCDPDPDPDADESNCSFITCSAAVLSAGTPSAAALIACGL
jgi:hypothetical protein